jgi:hypothetical protein
MTGNEHVKILQWCSFPSKIKIRKGSLYCQVMNCTECGMRGNSLKILVTWKWNTIKWKKLEIYNDVGMCKTYCIRLPSDKLKHSVHQL